MKTTKVLIGLFLAVSAAVSLAVFLAVGLLNSPGESHAQPAQDVHYYCHLAPGGDPDILVTLETQFGWEYDVDVGPGELLCLPAMKTRAGQPSEGTLDAPHTRTFQIDEWLPEPIYVNLTTQFGDYENVLVEHASSLVLPVSKEVIEPPGHPTTTLEAEPHYKCYDIWAPGPQEEVLVETQFFTPAPGAPVTVGDAISLCVPAGKNGAPIPDAPAGLCYDAHVPGQFALVNLITQFLDDIGFREDNVWVYDGATLCVPAIKEVVEPPQDPTFSISRNGPSVPAPVDPSDLVVRSPGGAYPPAVVSPCPAFGTPFCLSGGAPWPGDDGNALSLGQDFTLPPPDPANPDAHLFFSVAPGSTGFAGTGVNDETVGAGCIPEPEADEFGSAATGGNYQFMDGDGVANCTNPSAPALGLIDGAAAGPGDDLDALDPLNQGGTVFPVFVSLDQQSTALLFMGWSAADILRDLGAGIPLGGFYATAPQLGLDTQGTNSDDIDALCINDADGDAYYTPGVDIVWFSLSAQSATLPMIGAGPSDILMADVVAGGPPVIAVPAANLGLWQWDDELNALKCYEQPEEVTQRPTFSIEDFGPSTPNGGGPFDPADILHNPGAPAVCIPCTSLGLVGCSPMPPPPAFDDMDALSYGADFGTYSSQEGYLGFSVDEGSQGQPGTAVNVEAMCAPPEAEADEFTTPLDGTNTQYYDGDGAACGTNSGFPLGLVELPQPPLASDVLDALGEKDCWEIDADQDGFADREVYFSLTPGSPSLTALPATPADILVTMVAGFILLYAPEGQLGLQPGDDVNGLCLAETAWPPGNPDREVFDPDAAPGLGKDYLFFTLESSSPTVTMGMADAGDILYVPASGTWVIVDQEIALGLVPPDDVDAIKCIKGLVDISIDDYFITLPDGTPVRESDPIASVPQTISEWYDYLMTEVKHYYGVEAELSPPSVTSQVGWALYPVAVNPVGAIVPNVRFNAYPGDICTDSTGAPVPCGEGGVAGVPWDPASLPFPPPAGDDSCKDGIDNDDDGTFDHPVNNPINPDPDCVDIYDVHFGLDLDESVDTAVDRQVQVHCKEAGEFAITFENIELPLGADDIDPGSNLGLIDVTIICEEEPSFIADKMVENVWLDDGSDYPNASPVSPPTSVPVYDGATQHLISITSVDLNLGPDIPPDALVAFYADIPPGCYGRWYDDGGHFPHDTYTVGGDPFADPFSPEQMGFEDPDWDIMKKTDDPTGPSGFEIDLHFQTADYGIDEPVAFPQSITRFFDFHCEEPSTHTFYFCNKIEPKPPYEDPDFPWMGGMWPGNNVQCVPYDVAVIADADVDMFDVDLVPPSPYTVEPSEVKVIALEEDVVNNGPYGPVDALVTKELDVPAGCWGDIDGAVSGAGPTTLIHTETVYGLIAGGLPVPMSETLSIRCDATGTYQFVLRKDIEPVDPHVIDPVPEPPWAEDLDVTVEAPPQDPTFSIARGGPSTPLPVDPADLLVRQPAGAWPPTVVYPCPAFGLIFCLGMGAPLPGDEVNAVSLGRDFMLPKPDPANPDAYLFFSVAPGSVGMAGTGVNAETLGCQPEPEADEFGSAATGGNYQLFDGDGFAACANPPAPALGLTEPPPVGGPSDDLDALDPLNLDDVGPPIYGSLDQASLSLGVLPGFPTSAADIFADFGGGIFSLYAPALALGLDMQGPNSDDIDALCINDADGDGVYSAADTVWFSLAAGSLSLTFAGDSAADVFAAPFAPGAPVVPGGALGLMAMPPGPVGDDLNALKCYQSCVPPFTNLGLANPDSDCDGAPDVDELSAAPNLCGTRDPNDRWDFYDVPVPTIHSGGDMNNRDSAVTLFNDVLGVLEYSGAIENGPPNGDGRDYDDDFDMDTIKDGVAYDREVGAPWPELGPGKSHTTGPASPGAVTLFVDVLLVLDQSGHICPSA